jgi:Flp pilus assembly protein TadD
MRALVYTAILLSALPALAAEAKVDAPPTEVSVKPTYTVWGYKWDARQYVRQTAYDLNTTDVTQAVNYAAQINRCTGWMATTNLPAPYSNDVPIPAVSVDGQTINLPYRTIRIPGFGNWNIQGSYADRAAEWDDRGEYDKAIADYNRALAINPYDANSYNNRGFDWWKKGSLDKAIADYNQALAICPTLGAAYSNRGVAWDDKGEHDKAVADFNQALAMDPNIAATYTNRGTIEAHRGEYDQANADYYRALAIDPNFATGYENLGFFQASCPDPRYRNGKKAFENASRGYQLANGTDAFYTANSLAAAYAECGDFEKARAWQEKVVELSPPEDKQMETARLELFKQGNPYRSTPQPRSE